MAKRLVLKEINERAVPTATAETAIVFLWVIREDMCPDPRRDMKYPMERNRKSEPASPWLNPKSFSIVGSNGEAIIRAVKFNKKMDAMSKSGLSWVRKVSPPILLSLPTYPVSKSFKIIFLT